MEITQILPERFITKGKVDIDIKYINKIIEEFLDKKLNYLEEKDLKILQEISYHIEKKGSIPIRWGNQQQNYIDNIKNNKSEKVINYLIFRYKFEIYPKLKVLHEFPLYALLEPSSSCNLRCVMCYQCDTSFTRKPFMGLMNIDFFKNCIDCLSDGGTKALTLASRGEPTLHPKFSEMINYCKNKFIEFKINTNATRLDDDKIRSILEAEVNELVFSVDAHTSDLYQKIRPSINKKNNFDLVIKNIKKFNLIRKHEYPHSKTKTRVSGVVFREDQNIEEITNFWKNYVDDVAFVRAQNRWDTYMNEKVPLKSHCNYLWERFYIWFDGTTNPCDVDYKSYLSGGKLDPNNVSVEEIKRIWNSKKLNDIRNNHEKGNRQKVNPCDRCGIE